MGEGVGACLMRLLAMPHDVVKASHAGLQMKKPRTGGTVLYCSLANSVDFALSVSAGLISLDKQSLALNAPPHLASHSSFVLLWRVNDVLRCLMNGLVNNCQTRMDVRCGIFGYLRCFSPGLNHMSGLALRPRWRNLSASSQLLCRMGPFAPLSSIMGLSEQSPASPKVAGLSFGGFSKEPIRAIGLEAER